MRRFARWSGFVDIPARRKLHASPTPLLGGLAIAGGALLTFILLVSWLPISIWASSVIGTLVACVVIILIGLADDRYNLPPWVKLAGQLVAASILIFAGIQVRLPLPEWLNIVMTIVWIVGITNAMNFMDNMDGLSAGICAVASSFILLLAVVNEQHLVAALSAGLLGACLGFLRYNFRPATIFMGDAGSMFLGFLLALLCIQLKFPDNVNFVTWMVPVLIMAVPIFDMTLVVISRIRRGVNPFTTPGKDHLSHRLVSRGFSQSESVLLLYLLGGASGMAALFITNADIIEGYIMGFTAGLLGLVAIWRLERGWNATEAEKDMVVKDKVPGGTEQSA